LQRIVLENENFLKDFFALRRNRPALVYLQLGDEPTLAPSRSSCSDGDPLFRELPLSSALNIFSLVVELLSTIVLSLCMADMLKASNDTLCLTAWKELPYYRIS
jgi:hypothetical protein